MAQAERFLYIIHETQSPDICKLGFSHTPALRLSSIQCSTHRPLLIAAIFRIPGGLASRIEAAAKVRLGPVCVGGEWFRATPAEITAELRKQARMHGTTLVQISQQEAPMTGDLANPLQSLRRFLENSKSKNTRRAYISAFACFERWCESAGVQAMPANPFDLARYLSHLADRGCAASTIAHRCSGIRYAHMAAGHEPPTNAEGIKELMRGIKRTIGAAPNRKSPTTDRIIAEMLEHLPSGIRGKRDRALLLIGFFGAMRRSELVGLDVEDIERDEEGIRIQIRRSKTDQEGEGQTIFVPHGNALKPVEALDAWLAAAGIKRGPIFRGILHNRVRLTRLCDKQVERIVKACAKTAGFDPAMFAGHSLRTGFVTSALEHGADILKIMDVTRHKDIKTLKIYDRRVQGFRNHAAKDFL